ncbi:hypothetical protein [Nonomuraea rosea]|uniref:hypothetical protein n=1 Tax=Nonomuraea rosea TaxID=638574 RepID=UPI0031EA11E3
MTFLRDGLGRARIAGGVQNVATGYVTTLVLRSAFTAIPVERLGEPVTAELHELFRKRVGLARFIADLGLAL